MGNVSLWFALMLSNCSAKTQYSKDKHKQKQLSAASLTLSDEKTKYAFVSGERNADILQLCCDYAAIMLRLCCDYVAIML